MRRKIKNKFRAFRVKICITKTKDRIIITYINNLCTAHKSFLYIEMSRRETLFNRKSSEHNILYLNAFCMYDYITVNRLYGLSVKVYCRANDKNENNSL